ncbi:transposase [Haloferula rosea]|uniref:Transposase n=1 Tax=Haloferula rosea TaxID=490093 RepID=A0A934RDZ8_9BACT|nr:transposase [Haloferula rosea]MBK1828790.1 transposase [Haloferula rosea]
MAKARWIAPWKDSQEKPAIYHLISRVVDRRMAFGPEEREKFCMFMRMMENFTGCRVLSYCMMSNHFHLLLEVPPMPAEGLSDEVFLRRLGALYSKARVDAVAGSLRAARKVGDQAEVERIVGQYAYRMHDLSEFMKGLLQRFSHWFNRSQGRTGRLWEQRFKSVLVEDGVAARTMAAYIDLNPVRAGICKDPADYRWSSYAEAVAGGKRARAGLVRALRGHEGNVGTARAWAQGGLAKEYRVILLGKGVEVKVDGKVRRKGMKREVAEKELQAMEARKRDVSISKLIRHRVRYFSDGAVIGGRGFVDEVFRDCRDRFGQNRKTGARKPRGALAALSGDIWSARDLRVGIET